MNTLYQDGVKFIRRAVEQDQDNKLSKKVVLMNFLKGIEKLIKSLSLVENAASRRTILIRVSSYLDRAESIHKSLSPSLGSAANGGRPNGKTSNGNTPNGGFVAADEPSKFLDSRVQAVQTRWSDVVGLEYAKRTLHEAAILPITRPGLFKNKLQPWRGVLLYGPPGTGKSFVASAVAGESNSNFFSITASDMMSKWQGESEKSVRELFATAREHAPAVIFIDEVDSLVSSRGGNTSESSLRVKNQFLTEMDGVKTSTDKRVLVLAATNTPWTIDEAFLRRFEKRIYIPLPDERARADMFRKSFTEFDEEALRALAAKTEGYSGADIATVIKDASMDAMREVFESTAFKERDGLLYPTSDPPCPSCPGDATCESCGRIPFGIDKLPEDAEFGETPVDARRVERALGSNKSTSTASALRQFDEWTEKFGAK